MNFFKKYFLALSLSNGLIFISLLSLMLILSPGTPAIASEVYVIKIDDFTISPITAEYITGAIKKACDDKAECLIIELDTPGGLLSSTRSIVKNIMSAKIPVVVYIYPSGSRAGSAGVFITYSSHIAAMAPSTNIGAAHPVELGGERKSGRDILEKFKKTLKEKEDKESPAPQKPETPAPKKDETPGDRKPEIAQPEEESEESDVMGSKILNDTVAFIKAIAKERNRNIEWAEKSVTLSESITEQEALKKNVIEIIARDEEDLLNKLHGREVKINDEVKTLNTKNAILKYIPMNTRQRVLNAVVNPNIAYILMILGFYGLLYEITHPGIGVPGVAGVICIILAFYSMQTLAANYAGVVLIILGIILFIVEVKVPGFGLPTLGGIICMVLGSLILFESSDQMMRVSLSLIISLTLATALITTILVRAVFLSHRRRVVSGMEGLIGTMGRAQTDILPGKEGKVFVHGEIWDAVSAEEIKEGGKVEIVKVDGMTLEVKSSCNL